MYYEGQLSSDLGTSEDVYMWAITESQDEESLLASANLALSTIITTITGAAFH